MFWIKVLTRECCWKFSDKRVTIWFTPQPALRVLFLIFQTGFNCDCLTYLKETYHSVQRIIAELAELSTAYWSAREQMGRQVGEGGRCSVCQCLFSWLFSKTTTKRSLSCFPLNRKKQTSCKGANSKKKTKPELVFILLLPCSWYNEGCCNIDNDTAILTIAVFA